jgi:hypothetical protein
LGKALIGKKKIGGRRREPDQGWVRKRLNWNFYTAMNFYSSTTKYSYLPSFVSTPISSSLYDSSSAFPK